MFLVSKCCAGIQCRYRGTGYFRNFMAKAGRLDNFIALCPEQMAGLPTPREPCSVRGGRVIGRRTNKDYTTVFFRASMKVLKVCQTLGIKKAYLLKNSPACGRGYGITAKLLEKNGIEVIPV